MRRLLFALAPVAIPAFLLVALWAAKHGGDALTRSIDTSPDPALLRQVEASYVEGVIITVEHFAGDSRVEFGAMPQEDECHIRWHDADGNIRYIVLFGPDAHRFDYAQSGDTVSLPTLQLANGTVAPAPILQRLAGAG